MWTIIFGVLFPGLALGLLLLLYFMIFKGATLSHFEISRQHLLRVIKIMEEHERCLTSKKTGVTSSKK